jgi:hypothetical protein
VEIIMMMIMIIIIKIIITIKPMEYDDKGDLIILIVRTHQHNINSIMLQTAISIKENYREETDK